MGASVACTAQQATASIAAEMDKITLKTAV
jgi:hypothetical protein